MRSASKAPEVTDDGLRKALADLRRSVRETERETAAAEDRIRGLEAARGDIIFWLGRLPGFAAGDRALIGGIAGYHELAANLLLILSALHGGAALVHRFVWKDSVLARMTLG